MTPDDGGGVDKAIKAVGVSSSRGTFQIILTAGGVTTAPIRPLTKLVVGGAGFEQV